MYSLQTISAISVGSLSLALSLLPDNLQQPKEQPQRGASRKNRRKEGLSVQASVRDCCCSVQAGTSARLKAEVAY